MLTGTGKLFWHVVPLQGNKTLRYGGILVESSSPAGKKGCVITVTDPNQDQDLVLEGIDLTVPHDGTPVEFTAGKVPSHEVYYAIRVGQPLAAGAGVPAMPMGAMAGNESLATSMGVAPSPVSLAVGTKTAGGARSGNVTLIIPEFDTGVISPSASGRDVDFGRGNVIPQSDFDVLADNFDQGLQTPVVYTVAPSDETAAITVRLVR